MSTVSTGSIAFSAALPPSLMVFFTSLPFRVILVKAENNKTKTRDKVLSKLKNQLFQKLCCCSTSRPPLLIVNNVCPIKLLIAGGWTLSIERNVHDCSHVWDTVSHWVPQQEVCSGTFEDSVDLSAIRRCQWNGFLHQKCNRTLRIPQVFVSPRQRTDHWWHRRGGRQALVNICPSHHTIWYSSIWNALE